jgi:hypothetical protein
MNHHIIFHTLNKLKNAKTLRENCSILWINARNKDLKSLLPMMLTSLLSNSGKSETTRRRHWIYCLKTSNMMWHNRKNSSRNRIFWWKKLRALWPTCVIFTKFWKLQIQWFVKFRVRSENNLEVMTMKEIEAASMKT